MLLNEFLKEHRKVREQACEIEQQKAKISQLEKAMETYCRPLQRTGCANPESGSSGANEHRRSANAGKKTVRSAQIPPRYNQQR